VARRRVLVEARQRIRLAWKKLESNVEAIEVIGTEGRLQHAPNLLVVQGNFEFLGGPADREVVDHDLALFKCALGNPGQFAQLEVPEALNANPNPRSQHSQDQSQSWVGNRPPTVSCDPRCPSFTKLDPDYPFGSSRQFSRIARCKEFSCSSRFRSFYTNFLVNEAHNDYLQLLVEMGSLGFAALVWFVVTVYARAARKIGNWTSEMSGTVTLTCMLGLSGILVHSAVDFNLEIPANAALFYVLCTIAASKPFARPARRSAAARNRVSDEMAGTQGILYPSATNF
jgi:hypothetical protein